MRHSDPNLTANIYTDASQLPTFDAVASLDWEGIDEKRCTQIGSQKAGSSGQTEAPLGMQGCRSVVTEASENETDSRELAGAGRSRQMVGAAGFEPYSQLAHLPSAANSYDSEI